MFNPVKPFLSMDEFLPHIRIKPYVNAELFWVGFGEILYRSIGFSLYAGYYALAAIWKTACLLCNLLTFQMEAAKNALYKLYDYSATSLSLVVLTPFNTLASVIQHVACTVATWVLGPPDNTQIQSFSEIKEMFDSVLQKSITTAKAQFFKPYDNVYSFFKQVASPATSLADSLTKLFRGVCYLFLVTGICLGDIVLGKPKSGLKDFISIGLVISLSMSIAIITPILSALEGIKIFSRLGATFANTCEKELKETCDLKSCTP